MCSFRSRPIAEHPFLALETKGRRLMGRIGHTDPTSLDHYVATDGYFAVARMLDRHQTPEQVRQTMIDGGLAGRGGAWFPAGVKWNFLAGAAVAERYLICNADEGDPGAWVNRVLLEGDPHAVIERIAGEFADADQDRLDGLTVVKPPYGVIAAIDLNQGGKLLFQVPAGETPDNVRNHPLLRGLDIPRTGQGASVGIMVTKTMAVAGESQVTSPPGRGRGARLVAYDKKDGHELGSVLMPAGITGSPMTYSVNGRQYIIVGVSGGNYTGEYIAYALPQSELRSGN